MNNDEGKTVSHLQRHWRRKKGNASLEFMSTVTPDGSDCYFAPTFASLLRKV